ncbi:hypothetical protein MBLNU230_g2950t1 [Neophaeotheca triangularis]
MSSSYSSHYSNELSEPLAWEIPHVEDTSTLRGITMVLRTHVFACPSLSRAATKVPRRLQKRPTAESAGNTFFTDTHSSSQSGDAEGQPVAVSMWMVGLDKAPPYYAISYLWGDPDDQRPVLVNGFAIIPSLFWIYGIVINQENRQERSTRVQLMHLVCTPSWVMH